MKRLAALAAIALAFLATSLPALAAQFVQDGAGMFSPGTVAALEQRIGAFNAQTGKAIVIVTVPSLNGETRQQAAQTVFSEQRVNGILIFIAKAERQDIIVPGRATAQFFPAATTTQIREAMEAQFKNGDFDAGITTAVNQTLDVFRANLGTLPSNTRNYPATVNSRPVAVSNGFHLSMFWWIIIIVVGFLVIRSIFRSMGPRYYGGPGGPGMPGPGGMPGGGYGYGGPGYYGGGGGGFWSGLLGGLGGAWLGNEMFNRGNQGGGMLGGDQGGGYGGNVGNAPDPGGWGNDAGQADMGSSSGGDWGGGGFGGGDFGGGGGFGGGDSGGGGGGGDSGGGW